MFNLTLQEKQAVTFLACLALVGSLVHALAKKYSAVGRFVNVPERAVKIDVNKASFEELVATRVVSVRLARKIIEYRQAAGPLLTVDDLEKIKGVGRKKSEQLKGYLTAE